MGQFICGGLFSLSALAAGTFLGRWRQPNPDSVVGWTALVLVVLTVGFAVAAFSKEQ